MNDLEAKILSEVPEEDVKKLYHTSVEPQNLLARIKENYKPTLVETAKHIASNWYKKENTSLKTLSADIAHMSSFLENVVIGYACTMFAPTANRMARENEMTIIDPDNMYRPTFKGILLHTGIGTGAILCVATIADTVLHSMDNSPPCIPYGNTIPITLAASGLYELGRSSVKGVQKWYHRHQERLTQQYIERCEQSEGVLDEIMNEDEMKTPVNAMTPNMQSNKQTCITHKHTE